MATLERCPHPHAWPAVECNEGIELTRARRVPVCMCGHPKVVHQHRRPGLDCGIGKCDCRHYEAVAHPVTRLAVWAACILLCAAFWIPVGVSVIWPLLAAIKTAIFDR